MTTPDDHPRESVEHRPREQGDGSAETTWLDQNPELAIGREATSVIAEYLEKAPLRRIIRRIEDGYNRFGIPFAAYLRLDDIAITDERLIDRFHDVYAGSFRTMDLAIDNELDGSGWHDELREFRTSVGIEPAYLDWNYSELDALIYQLYDTVELDGWIHLFNR